MTNLDNREEVLKIDKGGALSSIEQLPQQCEQAWDEAQAITLPPQYKNVTNVVVCGMGASWLGAHIMQGLLTERLTVPLLITHDYRLPGFVNHSSLVITSSYSGTTEETVECLQQAYEKKANVITISTGGALSSFAKEHNLPHYTFVGTHNPANSPRLGLGYSIVAQMVFLSALGIITLGTAEMTTAIAQLKTRVAELTIEQTSNNEAKIMAGALQGFMPIVTSGTFLLGNAHAFANQFNETAKTFGTFMHIPELNHHLMEGLAHPGEVAKLKFIFLESNLYDPRVQSRFAITKEVVEQNHIGHLTYKPRGTTKIVQAFDTLLFSSFVTFYLAMLYGVDPAPNPWVDYFKKRLKEIAK